MCPKLFQTCILGISLILTSSLQVSYYYYPHFTDEKVRHGNFKQNVQGHTAGKQFWILTSPKMLPPIIFFPFSLGYSLTRSCTSSQVLLMGMVSFPPSFPVKSNKALGNFQMLLELSFQVRTPHPLSLTLSSTCPSVTREECPTWWASWQNALSMCRRPSHLGSQCYLTYPRASHITWQKQVLRKWLLNWTHAHEIYKGDKWLFSSTTCRENC